MAKEKLLHTARREMLAELVHYKANAMYSVARHEKQQGFNDNADMHISMAQMLSDIVTLILDDDALISEYTKKILD